VIRSADVIVHPAFATQRIGDKDPVDGAGMMSRRGGALGQANCVVKAGVAENLRDTAGARVEIEIASDDDHSLIVVRAAVCQNLIQLPETKRVVASAFKVNVVADNLSGVNRRFDDERNPAAQPALKDRKVRHKPPRLPEGGLVAETNEPGSHERASRQRRHPMVCGAGESALAEFLEFHSESVVQIEGLGQIGRDVATARPAGVQVHLLQQEQVGVDFPKEVQYFRELQAALDIPA
jgi:hypothetical protein